MGRRRCSVGDGTQPENGGVHPFPGVRVRGLGRGGRRTHHPADTHRRTQAPLPRGLGEGQRGTSGERARGAYSRTTLFTIAPAGSVVPAPATWFMIASSSIGMLEG